MALHRKKQVAQSCTCSWRKAYETNGILVLSGADKTDNHAEFVNNSAVQIVLKIANAYKVVK
jgi:hypothetical protein